MIRVFIAVCLSLFTGCTGSDVNYMIATGKRPPTFFQITDMNTMNTFVFDTKRFSFLLPQGKVVDFQGNRFWKGGTSRDGNTISLFNGPYHIDISTDYYPQEVGDYERAILQKNAQYFRNFFKGKKFERMYITHYGKESYPCLVTEYRKKGKYYKNSKFIDYDCYKFDPTKTKYQSVTISLTYSKPLDPNLAKIYTYEDLKQRAKRMLDSLYIKSWW